MLDFSKNSLLLSKREIIRFIDTYAKIDEKNDESTINWHEIDKKSANLGYGWIHYGLIRNLKSRKILTIGSRYGYIPAVCALACKANKKGLVDLVDAGLDQNNPLHKNHWGGVGFWKKVDHKKHFGKFKLDSYIKVHVQTSKEFFYENKSKPWDYIYIDGDHTYNGVKFDFEHSWHLLKEGGIISLHDIKIKRIGDLSLGVRKLWKELKKSKRYNMIEIPGKFGLGLIQK